MNTGTYYVFEYNKTRQIRNLGFLKITCNQHFFQFHLCIRGIAVARNDSLPLYAFHQTNEQISAFPIETVLCEDHSISTKLEIPLTHFPQNLTLDKIDGFFLMLPNQSVFATYDNNLHFDTQAIRFPSMLDKLSDQISAEPTPSPSKINKISRNDLARLPRRYWYLANNSFLLHGYHNYNHLLLVEEDGHYILGVPGIKDKYETQAAKMFGFSFFSSTYVSELSLTADEKESDCNFGYWCCTIPGE